MAAKNTRSRLTLAERELIKQQQASFIEKINTAAPNEHQAAIFEAAKSQQGRYVVLAGPGSGKTFTAIKASTQFTGSAIYFSYNKKIQLDTNFKLVAIDSKMTATTAHSFGLSCLMAFNRGQCKVDDKETKYPTLIKKYLAEYWDSFVMDISDEIEEEEADINVMRLDAYSWTKTLIHYAQVSLAQLTYSSLTALVEEFDLTDIKPTSLVWPFVTQAVIYTIEEGKNQFLGPEHLLNYDDMIYYPNVLPDVPIRQYDHILVDEAQDTSKASLELMMQACHKNTQVFFIGDRKQSIYAFAGANFNSIDQIIERLDAQILPLRICYRCGSKIVDLANQLGGQLISANLHEGNVEVISEYLDRLQPGDAVISRTTANLVKGCLKTLQKGKRAKVLGKNLGENISAIVTRLEARRLSRGIPVLFPNLSNFLDVLEDYHRDERNSLQESRKNPELALSELDDKVETVSAFYEAYISKCNDESLQVADDPKCNFEKTATDFKKYIHGLFSEDDSAKDFILYMTAHRSKGGEWENVYIINPDEFPHPKAKSDRQKQQENNLMYVAITRAISNLYFVGEPFSCLGIPGYEPAQPVTIISFPAADHLEIHTGREEAEGNSTVAPDSHNIINITTLRPIENETSEEDTPITVKPTGEAIEAPEAGKISRVLAIEVLCPSCNSTCVDPATGALSITEDLIGHTVICSRCRKGCIVPLNAFSLQGEIIAREKPATLVPNNQVEKKGRTKKERKSNAGRKTKSGVAREPMQLSLDVRTIKTLNTMGVNKSELFEELLKQYEPFLTAWSELGNETHEEDSDD